VRERLPSGGDECSLPSPDSQLVERLLGLGLAPEPSALHLPTTAVGPRRQVDDEPPRTVLGVTSRRRAPCHRGRPPPVRRRLAVVRRFAELTLPSRAASSAVLSDAV